MSMRYLKKSQCTLRTFTGVCAIGTSSTGCLQPVNARRLSNGSIEWIEPFKGRKGRIRSLVTDGRTPPDLAVECLLPVRPFPLIVPVGWDPTIITGTWLSA